MVGKTFHCSILCTMIWLIGVELNVKGICVTKWIRYINYWWYYYTDAIAKAVLFIQVVSGVSTPCSLLLHKEVAVQSLKVYLPICYALLLYFSSLLLRFNSYAHSVHVVWRGLGLPYPFCMSQSIFFFAVVIRIIQMLSIWMISQRNPALK